MSHAKIEGPKGKRRVRLLTDKEWSRRCAIGAGVLRGRLARKIAVQIMADIVVQGAIAGDDSLGHADAGRIQEVVKRVLKEEGF